jgi:hypothetical protein
MARFGQHQPLVRTLEKSLAHALLKFPQLNAQGRLRHVQTLGRSRQVLFVCDAPEMTQIAVVQRCRRYSKN